jgi:hypothetical protein
VPLTPFQHELLAELARSAAAERYLAGGAALHFAPDSARYSDDLDFFHDSERRVAVAFSADRDHLQHAGYALEVEFALPGFVRAVVRRGDDATRVDWAHDSAWRFMPLVRDSLGGWLLHPIDLAINKVLALAGRDEPRDYVDVMYVHRQVLPLAAMAWAAPGKDPGLTPLSLLELLRRHGRYRAEDFARLRLTQPFELETARADWLRALSEADEFVRQRPPDEAGCLYYSHDKERFVVPRPDVGLVQQGITPHFGRPGGVLPRMRDQPFDPS